jgi:hypothetical protein
MSEETKTQETVPEKVKVGEKEYSHEDLANKLANESKLQGVLHDTNRKLKEMEAKLAEKTTTAPKVVEEKRKLAIPAEGSESDFLERLIETVNATNDRVEMLSTGFKSLEDGVYGDTVNEIQEGNRSLHRKFTFGNNIKDDEVEEFNKILLSNRHNKMRANGKVLEITEDALQESLFILRKDQIKDSGKTELLKELFGKDKVAAKDPKDKNNPDVAWIAEHWNELTDKEKEEYRKMDGFRSLPHGIMG